MDAVVMGDAGQGRERGLGVAGDLAESGGGIGLGQSHGAALAVGQGALADLFDLLGGVGPLGPHGGRRDRAGVVEDGVEGEFLGRGAGHQ